MCHLGDHKNCKLLQSAFVFLVLFGQSALGYDFWGVDVAVQYELRQQGMFLASQRQTQLLPEANGGPSYASSPLYDPRPSNPITCSDGTAVQYTNVRDGSTIDATIGSLTYEALQYGTICQGVFGQAVPTYAGDINSDDWRLNFDRGDVLQAPSTLNTTVDLHKQSRFGDIWATINLEPLFDSALSDNSTFDRSGLDASGRDKVARYWQLDGYAQLKTRIFGNRALNILLGQQEIQWGEPTFLPGGISWFNPLDVPRFRQTGYTHGWIPVNALQTQFTWSRSLSFAGYWGGWDHYRFDVPGTYAGVGGDVWVSGAGSGGNQNRFIIGSGSYFTGNSWPCQYQTYCVADGVINTNTRIAEVLSAYAPSCPGVPDVLTPVEIGYAERDRIAVSDPWALIKRGEDQPVAILWIID